MYRIGEVGDWASEGQAAGVYRAGFPVGFLVTKIGKERGNSYQKMKRSPDERHK